MVNVSWNDAVAFCQWLSRQEGREYRLPTEAQWEYACRGGTTTRFYSGDQAASLRNNGNFRDRSYEKKYPQGDFDKFPLVPFDDEYAFTAPVGRFAGNSYGLHDMHGNVWEWCSDWYGEYSSTAQTDPTGPLDGDDRVFRGGSWFSAARFCRSAYRSWYSPDDRGDYLGFRLVSVSGQ